MTKSRLTWPARWTQDPRGDSWWQKWIVLPMVRVTGDIGGGDAAPFRWVVTITYNARKVGAPGTVLTFAQGESPSLRAAKASADAKMTEAVKKAQKVKK